MALLVNFLIAGVYLGWKDVPGFLKANFNLLKDPQIHSSLLAKNDLDTVHLNVSFKNLQKIQNKRADAIQKQRLVSNSIDFVNADIGLNEEEISSCKIRLKGHLSDHWSGNKFSLRIEIKDGKLIKGMSKFSVQDPKTRNYSTEWLFLNHLRKENCISVRYDFINLVINGKEMGVYAIEEHFSKEMIEANKRREGVICYFDDYFFWKKYPPTFRNNISWNSTFLSARPEVRNQKKVSINQELQQQAKSAIELLRSLQGKKLLASRILDPESTGKYLAITRMWETNHGFGIDDINFYFNPITALLEPIGFDGQSGSVPDQCFFSSKQSPWVEYALKDPKISKAYIFYLKKFTNINYINILKQKFTHQEIGFRHLLLNELLWKDPHTIWQSKNILKNDPWTRLNEKVKLIRDELAEPRLVIGYTKKDINSKKLNLFIRNSTSQPVEIIKITLGGKVLNASQIFQQNPELSYYQILTDKFILQPLTDEETSSVRFLNLDIGKDNTLPTEVVYVHCRFWGETSESSIITIAVEDDSFNPLLLPLGKTKLQLDNLKFVMSEQNTILVKEGNFSVIGNIYIPQGFKLVIPPGCSISFSKNSTFVSESPIHAVGTTDKPIYFKGLNNNWCGILLSGVDILSKFKNVFISDIRGVGKVPHVNGRVMNGWSMTGGVTIFNSLVEMKHCYFTNFLTEDALNIVSSQFHLEKCTFKDIYSDAFDGDFVTGKIKDCDFSIIGGDGVDFSGSNARIVDCNFSNISDKAISIGEASKVEVFNTSINGAAFGIVSKDLSTTTVYDSTIHNISNSAFSAYQKKKSFGPAQLRVHNSRVFNAEKDFLIQDKSKAWNSRKVVRTVPVNLNALYAD